MIPGVRGLVTYIPGGVSESCPLYVRAYADLARTIELGTARTFASGGRYDVVLTNTAPGTTVHLRAYYDTNCNHDIDAGDKWDDVGSAVVDLGVASNNISFSGSNTLP